MSIEKNHDGQDCIKAQDTRRNEKRTGGRAKAKVKKINSKITIYDDKTCVDWWQIKITTIERRYWTGK